MTFQKNVRFDQGFGVVGEIRFDGPHRAAELELADQGIVGRVYTVLQTNNAEDSGRVVMGGANAIFAGILANPKVYPYYGSVADSSNDDNRLTIPKGSLAEFVTMGFIVLQIKNSARVGDYLEYLHTTGEIQALAHPMDGSEPTPSSGCSLVPNARVDRYPQTNTDGGLILARLTN